MENRPLSSQSSLLLKRRVASRPDIKAAKGASSCSVQPSTTTTGSSNNGKHKSSKALHGPKKYFYNVKSFQLIVPCRLGHRAPSTATSLLRLLEGGGDGGGGSGVRQRHAPAGHVGQAAGRGGRGKVFCGSVCARSGHRGAGLADACGAGVGGAGHEHNTI